MSFQEQLLMDFRAMQDFRKGTGYTTSAYDFSLLPFITFCGSSYPDATHISKAMVDGWLAHRAYNKTNSQAVFITCLRQYAKFINAQGKDAFIPDEDYTVHHEQFVPYVFSDDELKAFFRSVDSIRPTPKKWGRDIILPVLFRLMYCCGMRPGEPMRLKSSDVNLTSGDIYIRQAKGSKDRHITMSEDLRQLCVKYNALAGRREWFFQKWDGGPLATYWMDRQFHLCWDKSGLPKRGNPRPYDLRHAFATRNLMRWTDEGRDVMILLPYLSAYMGHSNFQYTLYYVHLFPERLRSSAGINWSQFDTIYGEAE
jgi:integrase